MSKTYSLIFAGVGGQGSLLMAELTSLVAVEEGYDVKQSEVHGVSQRGGSVETHVRFGEMVYSPIVTPGEADVVIALEKLEALRFGHFVNPQEGRILVNDYELVPGSVTNAEQMYPYDAIEFLRNQGLTVVAIQASAIARELGDGRMANVVMLGVLSHWMPFSQEAWEHVLNTRIPERYRQPNLRAFAVGQSLEVPAGSSG